MPSVRELYELWAGDSELRDDLAESPDRRGTDWLFEAFSALGPQAGAHVDAKRGLAECARTLRPGAALFAYVALATNRLEPREADELLDAPALHRESFEPGRPVYVRERRA